MPTFAYRARNAAGQVVTGSLTAESSLAATRALDDRALQPTEIREVETQGRSVITGRTRRVPIAKVGQAYEQLADLLRAGVPILRSLSVLSQQSASPALSRTLKAVHEDVSGGDSLADSMEKHPEAFPGVHVAMVRAGEKGGFLEDVLARMSEFVSRQDTLRNKLIGSLIYPLMLFCGGILAVLVVLLYVVPKLKPLLGSKKLPTITQIVFGMHTILTEYWLSLIVSVALVIMLVWLYLRSETGKRAVAAFQIRAPMIGPIFTMVALCRFCRIFGTLLANGIPIIQSLHIARDSAGNPFIGELIDTAADNVSRGDSLAQPLARGKIFPPALLDMIAVAEESNTLEKVLVQIANVQEERTSQKIDVFMRTLEPLMLVLMAAMVLTIAFALMLPILQLTTGAMRG
ncbi:MAG: type II secretion system F family protein [Phycisphaerae bacterium]|nr:type II secretion system F family protein [Phycisphaerae bacterium]